MMAAGQVDGEAVVAALGGFPDPETGADMVATGQLRDVRVEGNSASLVLALSSHSAILHGETRQRLEQLLKQRFPQLATVTINLARHETPVEKIGQIGLTAKSVVAVGSGKGGVGKST